MEITNLTTNLIWQCNLLGVFVICVISAGILIPQILLISFRRKLFDEPSARKIHTSTVPRLGGIAFMPVIVFGIVLMLGIEMTINSVDLFRALIMEARSIAFAFCSLFLIYIVGLADDLIGVRYQGKFMVQSLCACMLIAGGYGVCHWHGFLGQTNVPFYIAGPFTILLTIFIVNAINLIDGIDGLASGLSSVALMFYAGVFILCDEYLYALLSMATLGVLVPFFYYNVFGNPEKQRKIFMGDTGSLTIGMILCILTYKMLRCEAPSLGLNMLIVAMSPLVIPCFDVIRVYIYRITHGKNPFVPDRNHIHHKLMAMRLSQRTALIIILCASIVFSVLNIMAAKWLDVHLVIAFDIVLWIFAVSILPKQLRRLRDYYCRLRHKSAMDSPHNHQSVKH